jgi:restriction system protein
LGIIFTTSTFSKDASIAKSKSGAVPIALIDGSGLVDIMIEKKFGIDYETMPVYISALDSTFTEDV